MANEIELNGLPDMDSLPNDWKISLIDPEPSKPAQNITVARFCELLTSKIPVATSESNGLLNAGDKSLIDGRLATVIPSLDGNSWVKVLSVPKDKEGFFSALTSGNRYIDMNPISELFNFQNYRGVYTIKTSILSLGETFDSRWRYTDNGSTIDIYLIAGVWLNNPMIVLVDDFGLVNETVLIPSDSKKPVITNITSSVSLMKNDLTETISDNYPILPPPANCVPNHSESAGSDEQFAKFAISETDNPDGSIPVKTEPSGEQYVWSINKIGKAVLELQEENKRLKQILNISDDSEVQQM